MMVRDLGGGTDGWTLIMRPLPPHDPRWLDLTAAPGQPAVRVSLDPSDRPPQDATVTTGPGQAPGDHVLHAVAARLLARAGPDGFPLPESTPRSGPLAPGTDGFGDVIAAVQAADALSPSSPVPGQFAALCARLHLPGHGVTAPPAHGLPGSWTGMHIHASGPMSQVSDTPAGLYYWPVTWIRDNGGRWHATRILGQSGIDGGTALRVEVVPPLSRATTGIEVIATGRSAQASVKLPLHWE